MEIIDITIVVLIAISTIIGIFRGFFKELMLIVVLVISLVVAYYGASLSAQWIPDGQWQIAGYTVNMRTVGFAVSFGTILFVVMILGRVLVTKASNVLHSVGVITIDRFFGGVFGLARGGLIIAIMVTIAGLTMLPSGFWWQQSRLLPTFERLTYQGIQVLPQQYREYFYFPSVRSHSSEN